MAGAMVDLSSAAASSSSSELLLLERARNLLRGNKRSATHNNSDELEDSASSRFPSEIIDMIMESLKTQLPVSGQEGFQQLMNIAVSIEKKIYAAATNESDYLNMISLNMTTMVRDYFQNPMADSVLFSAVNTSSGPPDQDGYRVNRMQFMQLSVSEELIRPSAITNKVDDLNGTSLSLSLPSSNMEQNESAIGTSDWRTHLPSDSRQRIVNKIMETLKIRLPFSGVEGLTELQKIAVRHEEKIYTAAKGQRDYLRRISLQTLTLETKSQSTTPIHCPPYLEDHRGKRMRFTEFSEEEVRPSVTDRAESSNTRSPVLFNFL